MNKPVELFLDSHLVRCPAGARVIDFIDEIVPPPLPTRCRAAHCGTCLVQVLEGDLGLAPPAPDERETLAALDAPMHARLGCQLVVNGEAKLVRLRSRSSTPG